MVSEPIQMLPQPWCPTNMRVDDYGSCVADRLFFRQCSICSMYDQYGPHVGRKRILDYEAASQQSVLHAVQSRLTAFSRYYIFATISEFIPFLIRNRFGLCWPRVTKFLRMLREDKGATLPVGIAGFCWGGLHAIKLTHDTADAKTADGRPLADAVFTAHPSSVTVPQDIADVKGNLSIAIGDDDGVMGIKQVRAAQEILADKRDVDSEVVIYPGAKHGFSIRASRAQPDSKETKQAEEAEKQAISWFQRHFEAAKRR